MRFVMRPLMGSGDKYNFKDYFLCFIGIFVNPIEGFKHWHGIKHWLEWWIMPYVSSFYGHCLGGYKRSQKRYAK